MTEGECNNMSVLTADSDIFTLSLMIKEDYKELKGNINLSLLGCKLIREANLFNYLTIKFLLRIQRKYIARDNHTLQEIMN